MKRKKLIWIIIGAVVVLTLVIVNLSTNSGNVTTVQGEEAKRRDLTETVSASGRIQPQTMVDITSEVNGEIVMLGVREGDRVETGDLLVVLDTVQLITGVDQARYAVAEIKARLEGARSNLEQAQEEFDRQTSLFERGLSSDAEFKNAKYAFANAKASFEATKAQTKQLESRYEMQLDNLSKAKIVAPMPGVITFVDCEVGEIAAAQTPYTQGRTLMTISNLESFEVEVEVDETEINKIALSQAADIEVDAFPDTTFAGRVVEIGNTAITQGYGTTEQSTNFRVKVVFTDPSINLRPGMSATTDITTAECPKTLTIPYSAVVMRSLDMDSLERARQAAPESSGTVVGEVHAAETDDSMTDSAVGSDEDEREELKGVFVIREGKAHFVVIETGIADQKNIEVLEGLEDGDSVVSGPYRVLRTIRDGDVVEIRKGERDEGEA